MNKELTPETLLTVKEASELTNLTVPTFYTEKRKRDLNFYESSGPVWMIRVADLIEAHMLTPDFKPTRGVRMGAARQVREVPDYWQDEIDELKAKVEFLYSEIARLQEENAKVQLLADERANQLDMVNRLISTLELRN